MKTLTPSQAASIASGVYLLREQKVSALAARQEPVGCEGMFTLDDSSRFEGRSGGMAWKATSGFGYIAVGTGEFAGEALIATRGTAVNLDWLTNFNVGLQFGPGGMPVHAGFNEVWKSFAPEIRNFLRVRNPTRIHCVGHSLGGALASLNADMLSAGKIADVVLYTFGSPRTGDGLFANSLTNRVGADQIYRVAHPADPVPMIPLFPFWHLPFGQGGLAIGGTSSSLVSVQAHLMGPSYIPGVRDHSWATLVGAGAGNEAQRVQSWLEKAAEGKGSFVLGSARLLSMIGRALAWLLDKAGKLVMGGLGVAVAVGATVLDQLSWLLGRAAQLSKELGMQVKGLMSAIFGYLGRKIGQATEITAAFLAWVLELLYSSLSSTAIRALSMIA